jgi:predicted glycoside hydrolase/deacetylase ChbG (UPF0249 family)
MEQDMPATRFLIVNADDFGQSSGINRGIITASEQGIVSSASLMVRWPAAAEAGVFARAHPDFSVGLHFDLGEWFFDDQAWVPHYEIASTTDAEAIRAELARQLRLFRELTGREPTHLDSHQHVHRQQPVRGILIHTARQLGISLRHFNTAVRYCGSFYGQTDKGETVLEAISVEALSRILRGLPPGTSELACHPGLEVGQGSMYRAERAREVETLCDPRLRDVLRAEQIELRSFKKTSSG